MYAAASASYTLKLGSQTRATNQNNKKKVMDYLVVALCAFLASGLTLYSGFGLGTLLLPVFAFFFPVEVAVGATVLVHGANNIL